MKNWGLKLKGVFRKISLVDRFLLLFMLILLVYMAVNLLTGTAAFRETNTVDIIVRTSAAAIFGYFVSRNFIKTGSSGAADTAGPAQPERITEIAVEAAEKQIKNRIGFEIADGSAPNDTGKAAYTAVPPSASACNKVQVIVVSVIGLFSLILLVIARRFTEITPEMASTVSQLQDFVSACVGFLISCGKGT